MLKFGGYSHFISDQIHGFLEKFLSQKKRFLKKKLRTKTISSALLGRCHSKSLVTLFLANPSDFRQVLRVFLRIQKRKLDYQRTATLFAIGSHTFVTQRCWCREHPFGITGVASIKYLKRQTAKKNLSLTLIIQLCVRLPKKHAAEFVWNRY